METFHIKNFDRLQHYKDRSPPWIKLYNGLLDDYEFARLPDASKAHLIAIGLLASRYSNKIPLDAEWIARRINATSPIDLPTLIKSGFIIPDQDCSNLLAERLQNARPEREGETQVREREETILSETEKVSDLSMPKKPPRKKPYSEPFEQFWHAYPTDPIMSKKKAWEQWAKLSEAERTHAIGAIPGFRDFCSKNKTYRPVHAERFLSQKRFEGFANTRINGSGITPADLARLAHLEAEFDKQLGEGVH